MNIKVQKDAERWGRNFWLLLMGKVVSQLGDGIFSITMPWYILSITDSAIAMSLYLILQNVACGVGLIIFGRKIDTWKKEKIMYTTDFIRGIYLLFLFLITLNSNLQYRLVYVYIGAIVLNLCMSAFNPASMSIIPMLIKKRNLIKANSILSVVDNTIAIIGLSVGVAIYEFLGIKLVFLLAGISYSLSGFSEMFIHPQYNNMEKSNHQERTGLLSGLSYLKDNKKILFIIIFALVWNYIYITMYSIYLPYIFNKTFGGSIGFLGMIQIVEGIGLILGATLAAKININKNIYSSLTKVVFIQLPLFIGFTLILIFNQYIFSSVYFVVILFTILFFVLGTTVAIVNVNVNVIIQTEADSSFIGRVNSIKSLGSMISMTLGLLLGGIIIESLYPIMAFGINSILFLLLTIFMKVNFISYEEKEAIYQ